MEPDKMEAVQSAKVSAEEGVTEFKLPVALVQDLVNYLQMKPYVEVFEIMGKLLTCVKEQQP